MTYSGSSFQKTIVVIGATGHFGGRICRRLVGEKGARLVVAGRRFGPAERFATELRALDADYEITAASLDQRSEKFEEDLSKLSPFLVIHTVGPYQGQDYRVARACIRSGAHYIDLADGRAFVEGFKELDAAARSADLLLVTGASTLPGLSSAVLASMETRFTAVRDIEISIAPAHQTPRGRGTIAAVLSYCGKPFPVLENGQWVTRYGWQNLRLQSYPAIGRRLSGACDVPDLSLFPAQVPTLETVTFHAALEAWWEQLGLWVMAWITRGGLVRDWTRFVPRFEQLSRKLQNLGSDMGGMHVRLKGTDHGGGPAECIWQLTAGDNHGPEIPCSPALVLARKLIQEKLTLRGALPCFRLMSLSDFAGEVSGFNISWEVAEQSSR